MSYSSTMTVVSKFPKADDSDTVLPMTPCEHKINFDAHYTKMSI